MNTRRLVPLAALAMMAAPGCTPPLEATNNGNNTITNEKLKDDRLPVAPPPRPKSTVAELLIGDWHMINNNGTPLGDSITITISFHADRKYIFSIKDQKNGHQKATGTYQLLSDTELSLTSDTNNDNTQAKSIIKNIDKNNLIIDTIKKEDNQTNIFKKITK